MISIPIECPKWLHRQLAEDAKRNGMTLEDWVSTLLAQHMYCEKEETMELDMTKPVRLIKTKKRFYPSTLQIGEHIYGFAAEVEMSDPLDVTWLIYSCRKDELENIPEPVKQSRWVKVYPDGSFTSTNVDECEKGWTKLTVWRDESGKTHVEVCDER